MPLFFLHIRNGLGFIEDEEGSELPDHEAARIKAVRGARSIIAEEVLGGEIDLEGSIEVADEAGKVVLTVSYAEAVRVRATGERAR